MADMLPMIAFVGRSNCGKTTLLEKLIPLLQGRGYRVGVVKHTAHVTVETDAPGTDTRRLWDSGVAHVTLAAGDRVVHTHRYDVPPALEAVLAGMHGVDIVLVEGYKGSALPKIEVVRAVRDPQCIPGLIGRIACVTDVADLACDGPRFGLEKVEALADFIERAVIRADVEG